MGVRFTLTGVKWLHLHKILCEEHTRFAVTTLSMFYNNIVRAYPYVPHQLSHMIN